MDINKICILTCSVGVLLYYSSRSHLYPYFIVIFTCIAVITIVVKELKLKFDPQKYLAALLISTISILVFASLLWDKSYSFDGLRWYIRNTRLLTGKSILSYIEVPYPPYLGELLLSFFWNDLYPNISYLAICLVGVGVLFVMNKLYEEFGFSRSVRLMALVIFATSNMFIGFTVKEFKVDLLALLFFSIALLYSVKDTLQYRGFVVGLFLGLMILTKVLYVVFLPIVLLYLLATKKYTSFSLAVLTLLFMFGIWVFIHGISIPGTLHMVHSKVVSPQVSLDRNVELYESCIAEEKVRDYGQFFYNTTFFQNLSQPFYYMLDILPTSYFYYISFADPGVLLYLSFYLLVPVLYFKLLPKKFLITLLLCMPAYLYFFVAIRTVYWYMLPILMLLAVTFPYMVESMKDSYVRTVAQALLLTVILFNIAFILYELSIFYPNNSKIKQHSAAFVRREDAIALSEFLNTQSSTDLILDASIPPHYLHNTYVKNYDKRILESRYYYATVNKDISAIHQELVAKGINYIVVNKALPKFDSPCAQLEQLNLNSYLRNYAHEVYDFKGRSGVFELNKP